MNEPISCNLIENALDYLILSGEQARENNERMLKHSLATLADGIELLLKARLEIDGWHLLFADIDKADQVKLKEGDFLSVSCEQAIKRLKDICSVEIDKQRQNVIEKLRKLRNKIRHFAIDTNREEVISLITKAYSFAIDFTTNHLESHYGNKIESDLDRIRLMLGEFSEFVNHRWQEIEKSLRKQDWFIECPKCTQRTLCPSEGHAKCVFCGYDRTGEVAALDLYEPIVRAKDHFEIQESIRDCPECGRKACIYDEAYQCWVCLSCGETYQKCTYCFELFSGEPTPGGACEECWQELLEKYN